MISEKEQAMLERKFDRDEVLQVVKDLQGDKAPGLMVSQLHFSRNAGLC